MKELKVSPDSQLTDTKNTMLSHYRVFPQAFLLHPPCEGNKNGKITNLKTNN
jgi:hypothetical protein